MAIMAECPVCKRKVAVKHKTCKCGEDLVKAKQGKRVKYHIVYRVKGKQKWQLADKPYSIENARACEGKLRGCKAENRILEPLPDSKMLFRELADWYLDLERVKALSSQWRVKMALDRFNETFGDRIVNTILPSEIENYQGKRKAEGKSDATIDQEVGAAKTVINKAFNNDMVGGDSLKRFKRVKKLLKAGANRRDKVLSIEEADALMEAAPAHIKPIVATAYHTGMRKGEILNLKWNRIDMQERTIRLTPKDTKSGRGRIIPISESLYPTLKALPKSIHHGEVFLFKGKPITDIRGGLRKACKGAEIPYGRSALNGFTFHDLRHTFNTDMRKAGVHESVIKKIMGHEDPGMFSRYNTIDLDDLKGGIERLDAFRSSVRQPVRQNEKANG